MFVIENAVNCEPAGRSKPQTVTINKNMTTRKSRGIIVETNILKKHTEAYYEKNWVFGICKNVEGGGTEV